MAARKQPPTGKRVAVALQAASAGGSLPLRSIVVVGYDGVEALDLFGPLETFARTRDRNGKSLYEARVISPNGRTFITESGVRINPHCSWLEIDGGDSLIIPGGVGIRSAPVSQMSARWIAKKAGCFRRVAAVCTGVFALAESGLLNGRRATTHWAFADEVAAKYPLVKLDPDSLFVSDGKFFTSAGVTAGIDLALALIEADCGRACATTTACEMVVYLKRPGGQHQFSEPLRLQIQASEPMGELSDWIRRNLSRELDVAAMATEAKVSPRQLNRRFRQLYGISPAAYLTKIRLDVARLLLAENDARLREIAAAVGFRNDDSFRRAFERSFGINPSLYRRAFRTTK